MPKQRKGLAGDRIGRYEIVSLLGAGGMGEVYEAYDTLLRRKVALKLLPADLIADADRSARFLNEARAASALNHPNIATVYDAGLGSEGGADHLHGPFIAMELIEGKSLREAVSSANDSRRLDLIVQVAEALRAAHRAGIVHRDLKPDNIMVTSAGTAKVLDFGLAKLATHTGQESSRTDPGTLMGTIGYMSPEQIKGGRVDLRSDIFSLGCVIYESFSGQPPFRGASPLDTLHRVLHEEPAALSIVSPTVPRGMEQIVQRCLAKDVDKRYPDVESLLADLLPLKRPGLEESVATAVLPRSRRRSPWLVGIVAALGLIIVSTLLWTRAQPERPSPRGGEPPAKSFSVRRVSYSGDIVDAVISGDGRHLALIRHENAGESLWIHQRATEAETRLLTGRMAAAAFGPGSNYIYFLAPGATNQPNLYRIPTVGGPPEEVSRGVYSRATFSPTGDRMAVIQRLGATSESSLVVMAIDGSSPRTIMSWPTHAGLRLPAWSADGLTIAGIESHEERGDELVEIEVADSSKKVVTPIQSVIAIAPWSEGDWLVSRVSHPEPRSELAIVSKDGSQKPLLADANSYLSVSVTRDGRSIVAVQSQSNSNIWLLDPTTGVIERQVTNSGSLAKDGYGLEWTPENRLLFASVGRDHSLWSIRPDGSERTLLARDGRGGGDAMPYSCAISPNGRQIAYSSPSDRSIWRVNANGTERLRLTTNDGDFFPQWTRDGASIIYGSQPRGQDGAGGWVGHRGIWRVAASGGEPVPLNPDCRVPRLARKGDWMVSRCEHEGRVEFAILSLDGEPLRWLPTPGNYDSVMRVTPEDQGIAYVGTDQNIWIVSLAGAAPHRLTNLDRGRVIDFAWSNDGRHLAVSREIDNSDAVVMARQ